MLDEMLPAFNTLHGVVQDLLDVILGEGFNQKIRGAVPETINTINGRGPGGHYNHLCALQQ
jgi:hypothetical protein